MGVFFLLFVKIFLSDCLGIGVSPVGVLLDRNGSYSAAKVSRNTFSSYAFKMAFL